MTIKKSITLLIAILSSTVIFAQTVKNEYYDYHKTKIKASYQVNSVGEKNGWFKGYDEYGVVEYEYNFKNNQYHGICIEYNTNGKRVPVQSETYKEGVLHGHAKYYVAGSLVMSEGDYVNGEKEGVWKELSAFSNSSWPSDVKIDESFVAGTYNYVNGKQMNDGPFKLTYQSSGALFLNGQYIEGKQSGLWTWYQPDGKVLQEITYDSGNITEQKKYLGSGKLKLVQKWVNGKYTEEEFNDQGISLTAIRNEKVKVAIDHFYANNFREANLIFEEDLRASNMSRDEYKKTENGMYYEASSDVAYVVQIYNGDPYSAIERICNAKKHFPTPKILEIYSQDVYPAFVKKVNEDADRYLNDCDVYRFNAIIAPLIHYLSPQDSTNVNLKVRWCKESGAIASKIVSLRDKWFTNPYSQSRLGEKIILILTEYDTVFINSENIQARFDAGDKLINAYGKLLSLTDEKLKEISKATKKVEDIKEIKRILEI